MTTNIEKRDCRMSELWSKHYLYRIILGLSVALIILGVCKGLGVPMFLTGWWACTAFHFVTGQMNFGAGGPS